MTHPLPLLSHWNTDHFKPNTGWSPSLQLSLLKDGSHILPWMQWPVREMRDDERELVEYCRNHNLPMSFVSTQWEYYLLDDHENRLQHIDGSFPKKLSPLSPIENWTKSGEKMPLSYFNNEYVESLQALYPNPPYIILLTNNETPKVAWHELETSKRFIELFGNEHSEELLKLICGHLWVQRYSLMLDEQKECLTSSWQNSISIIAYNAYTYSPMGRWWGWHRYTNCIERLFSEDCYIWDGFSSPCYTSHWSGIRDHIVWSPQIESMNFIPQLKELYNVWHEISVWDGNHYWHPGDEPDLENSKMCQYLADGQDYPPERYGGYSKFLLWLNRPNVLREYRDWTMRYEPYQEYFQQLIDGVDEVHNNAILRYFWENGELVESTEEHPYQEHLENLSDKYKDHRWFLLNTDLMPERPFSLMEDIPVYSIAYRIHDEYLIYAHSPLYNISNVIIDVPNFGSITTSVERGGTFIYIDSGGTCTHLLQ